MVINASGLNCYKVAKMILPNLELKDLSIKYAKGHYFSYRGKKTVKRLVYPIPDKNLASLGTHLTLDLSGKIKFGPDIQFVSDIDYKFTATRDNFVAAVRAYFPSISHTDLVEDYVGIRPKIETGKDGFKDFHISNHDGFINLMGIESPGLTSSLAIAEEVMELIYG